MTLLTNKNKTKQTNNDIWYTSPPKMPSIYFDSDFYYQHHTIEILL